MSTLLANHIAMLYLVTLDANLGGVNLGLTTGEPNKYHMAKAKVSFF